jgi:hypothetical protein
MLSKLYKFDEPLEDLAMIYCQYIRSILEYNSNVWFSAISEEEKEDIERVQRIACRIILKEQYTYYEQALDILNLQKSEQFSNLFPKNVPTSSSNPEKFDVKFAKKGRLYKSTIPAMHRLLNNKKK